jgi:hypothetical protein
VRIPVNYVFLEGPDLSGKTSLYQGVHRSTGFEWNIQDRSALSMLCYARQYGRDVTPWREQLSREVNHLNNRIVVLLPSAQTLISRFRERGDDFQTESSLLGLREIFEEEASQIAGHPNVLVVRTEMGRQDLIDYVVRWVRSSIDRTPYTLACDIRDHAEASGGESFRLTVDACLGRGFHDKNVSCLVVEEEKAYYARIRQSFRDKIKNELAGLNEYGIPQRESSRRFIHAEDTCISLLHAIVRGKKLHFSASLRSSNVVKTLQHDLDFLYLLVEDAHTDIGVSTGFESDLHLSIQSAHLVP